mgnify:FL=1
MQIDKFRLMISHPDRTKPELKQILANLGSDSPDLSSEVKGILDKRFPTWARPVARRAKAKK